MDRRTCAIIILTNPSPAIILQGEVDVVDLPAKVTVEAEIEETGETHELERSEVTTPGKKEDKKSKKKEKEKKKKQKDKKGNYYTSGYRV